jgi:hypothetical protein
MDRRQAKKRFASASRSSSPQKQKRRVESSFLLNSSRSSEELDRDSGLETFISDCHSADDTFDFSAEQPSPPELPFSCLRTDEKLRVDDSPIVKHMQKMSVVARASATKSPKKLPSASKVLQVSQGKKWDNFVIGKSIIKSEPQENPYVLPWSGINSTIFFLIFLNFLIFFKSSEIFSRLFSILDFKIEIKIKKMSTETYF